MHQKIVHSMTPEGQLGCHCELVEAHSSWRWRGTSRRSCPCPRRVSFDGVRSRLGSAALQAHAAGDPDVNMTEKELREATWTSHSFRRGADKQARRFAKKNGVPLERVDLSFGWNQRLHAKDMQMRPGSTLNAVIILIYFESQ